MASGGNFLSARGLGALESNAASKRGASQGRLPRPHIETRDGELIWGETVFAHLLDRKLEEGMNPCADQSFEAAATLTSISISDSRRMPPPTIDPISSGSSK